MKKKLEAAAKDRTLVSLWRDDIDASPVNGFVLGVGAEWVLLTYVSEEIAYNGFVALRLKDITEVESPHVHAAFITRALELKKLKEPDLPDVELLGTGPLIMSAGRSFPIVTLSRELTDPDTCQIGMPVQVQAGTVSLMEIDANAVWYDDVEFYRLDEITRLDFGGGYEEALTLVGGSN